MMFDYKINLENLWSNEKSLEFDRFVRIVWANIVKKLDNDQFFSNVNLILTSNKIKRVSVYNTSIISLTINIALATKSH